MFQAQSSLKSYRNQPQTKDIVVCDEILATVENFRTFLNEQKKTREELVTLSQQPLLALKEELNAMLQQVSKIISGIRRLSVQKDRLKEDLLKEEKNVGLAQRSCEAGHGSFDNSGISQYFSNKLTEFEMRIKAYRTELEALEENISTHGRYVVSPRDFMVLLRQIDNEFVCLAANVQSLCEEVKTHKARYLKVARASGGDCHNPFSEIEASRMRSQLFDGSSDTQVYGVPKNAANHSAYGPSPFMSTTSFSSAYPNAQNGNFLQYALLPGANMFQQPNSLTATGFSTSLPSASFTLSMPTTNVTTGSSLNTISKPFSFGLPTGAVTTASSQPFSQGAGLSSTTFGFGSTPLITNKAGDIFGKRLAI